MPASQIDSQNALASALATGVNEPPLEADLGSPGVPQIGSQPIIDQPRAALATAPRRFTDGLFRNTSPGEQASDPDALPADEDALITRLATDIIARQA